MGIEAALVASASAFAAWEAQKRAMDANIQAHSKLEPVAIKVRPAKCPSCGSREFRQHAGRSVCSYCRSES